MSVDSSERALELKFRNYAHGTVKSVWPESRFAFPASSTEMSPADFEERPGYVAVIAPGHHFAVTPGVRSRFENLLVERRGDFPRPM